MIDHTGIGASDVARSATFYDAVLGALGYRRVHELPDLDGVAHGTDFAAFWIVRFHPHGAKQHTAFTARNRPFRKLTWREGPGGKLSSRFAFCPVKVANDDGTDAGDREPMWLVIEWPEG